MTVDNGTRHEEDDKKAVTRSDMDAEHCPRVALEGIEEVVGANITISALMSGFMFLFLGVVLPDCKQPTLAQILCLFFAAMFLEYFHWAMIKSWNLLTVRTMAETADKVVRGELTSGPAFAAFRVLRTFQPTLFLSSRILFLVISLYAATVRLLNVLPILAGMAAGYIASAIHARGAGRKNWQYWHLWDRSVYLGEPISSKALTRYQRVFAWLLREHTEEPAPEAAAPGQGPASAEMRDTEQGE